MAFFKRRNKEFLDLTEKYKRNQEKATEVQEETSSTDNSNAFGFLGNIAAASTSSSDATKSYTPIGNVEEKRRQLSKRLLDMTDKIEDISNQIYHLQQRIEVLERKSGVGGYWSRLIKFINVISFRFIWT